MDALVSEWRVNGRLTVVIPPFSLRLRRGLGVVRFVVTTVRNGSAGW